MIIRGVSYRYDVIRIVNEGKFTNEYALHDNNTDLVLAYGTKKEITIATRLLCLGGTVGLAEALASRSRKRG